MSEREAAPRRAPTLLTAAAAIVAALFAGCQSATPARVPSPYASAEQVETEFRNRPFILGTNDQTALVRPINWPANRHLKLPFWLGINVLVPGVMQPSEGNYYVISQARLLKPLDAHDDTWLLSAGSHLVKQEAVFVTTRTHYLQTGTILPTIVQFTAMRQFPLGDGRTVKLPVLREVSLPMKWTLGGEPNGYARYRLQ